MTVEVPVLAASFASKLDTIGPYVGFGSLIAVIAMAILLFAQGRELQRLREWAGTAPERLRTLEQRLEQSATPSSAPRPGTATPGRLTPHPGAQTPATPATASAPASVPPAPATANPGAAAVPPPPLAAGAATGASATPPRPVPPVPGSGAGQATRVIPTVAGTPRASTPVGRANAARQRQPPEPPKRSAFQVLAVAAIAAVVIVGVLFAVGVIGGDTDSPVAKDNAKQQRQQDVARKRAKSYSARETSVVVLNATGQGGLARTGSDVLDNRRFVAGKVADYSEAGVPAYKETSTVAYRAGRGNREAAKDIAKYLGLPASTAKPMTDTIAASVDGTPQIVVVLGQDYASKERQSSEGGSGAATTTTTEPAPPSGSTGASNATSDAAITGDASGDTSGDITGDVVADTTIRTP